MATMRLEIITAERQVYADDVEMVVAPGMEGQLGILAHHAPLMTALQPGEILIRKDGEDSYLAVTGGFMEVIGNTVTILADACEHSEEIDETGRKRPWSGPGSGSLNRAPTFSWNGWPWHCAGPRFASMWPVEGVQGPEWGRDPESQALVALPRLLPFYHEPHYVPMGFLCFYADSSFPLRPGPSTGGRGRPDNTGVNCDPALRLRTLSLAIERRPRMLIGSGRGWRAVVVQRGYRLVGSAEVIGHGLERDDRIDVAYPYPSLLLWGAMGA